MKKPKDSCSDSLLTSTCTCLAQKHTSRVRKQAGIAAVEFTLILPLMLLFIAAIGEFGNILIKYNTLSKAVQTGARLAVTEVYGTGNPDAVASDTEISNAVNDALSDFENITITLSRDGNLVIVTADYQYQSLMGPLLDNIITPNVTLTSTSVMRVSP